MTIDEAIKHAEEVAEKNEKKAKSYPRPDKNVKGSGRKYNDCIKCAFEHRRLAEWLKELKQLREQETKWIPASERLPEIHEDAEVLDKIRVEIEDAAFDLQEIDGEHKSFMVVDLNDVLNIIDKHKSLRRRND